MCTIYCVCINQRRQLILLDVVVANDRQAVVHIPEVSRMLLVAGANLSCDTTREVVPDVPRHQPSDIVVVEVAPEIRHSGVKQVRGRVSFWITIRQLCLNVDAQIVGTGRLTTTVLLVEAKYVVSKMEAVLAECAVARKAACAMRCNKTKCTFTGIPIRPTGASERLMCFAIELSEISTNLRQKLRECVFAPSKGTGHSLHPFVCPSRQRPSPDMFGKL